MNAIKAGQVCFWLDSEGLPLAGVITKATLTGKVESLWSLKALSSKKWELSLWHRRDDKPPEPNEYAVEFEARTKQEAQAKARTYIAACKKIWNPEIKTAFTDVPASEQERWQDAWIQAHKSEWPNLFNVQKGKPVDDAIAADLIAMGFDANGVTTITLEIAKLAAKTKITSSDKLNLWIVKNWFHGEKLSVQSPTNRAKSARKNGFSCSVKSLGMRLTRLGLTARQ